MKRLHVHVAVEDLALSPRFRTTLFAAKAAPAPAAPKPEEPDKLADRIAA